MNLFGQAAQAQTAVAQAQAAAQGQLGAAGSGQLGLQLGLTGLAKGQTGLGAGQAGFFGSPFFQIQCLFGLVNLFRFIQPPAPGTIIGELRTRFGSIPLIQTLFFGGVPLSRVDGQFAILCGFFTFRQNRLVFDVLFVIPLQPTPFPFGTQPLTQETS